MRCVKRSLFVLVGLGLVAACGSTVPRSAQLGAAQAGLTPGGQAQAGSPNAAGPAAQGADSPAGVEVPAAPGGGASRAGVPAGPVGQPALASGATDLGAAAGQLPVSGPGWDARNVYIGVTEIKDQTTAMTNVGLKGVAEGDAEAQADAVANWVNSHGGILGRRLSIVFDNHANAAVTAQPSTEAQASCTTFTQDHRVVAVVNTQTGLDLPSYRTCLAQAGIPLFGVSISPIDDRALKEAGGSFYPVIVPTWNRFAPVFASRLEALGYFTGWNTTLGGPGSAPVKVGAFVHDDPVSARAYQLAAAAFAKEGHPVAAVFRWVNDNDASNAVLQFRSAGITHVFGLDAAQFLFAIQAESQHYRPRYAVQTGNGPGVAMEANAPAAQNVGALGVGTAPALDINHETGDITPGGKLCRTIMAANGQTFQGAYFAEAFAYSICDAIRAAAAGFAAARNLGASALSAGLIRVGPGFHTAMTFASGLVGGYTVFSGAGYDIGYQTSCNCYNYLDRVPRPF